MSRITTITMILCTSAGAAQLVVDRIAVSIGNQVITESAVILDLRVSAFLDRVPVDLSPAAKRKSAERLVDQILILRDAAESHLTLPSDAEPLLKQVRASYASQLEYEEALRVYKIQESDVAAQLLSGLTALTFTELRFQPAVQITEEDLRAYYNTVKDGASFEAAREEIEAVITRQRISEALDQWLESARAAARVEYREQVFR